MAGTSSDGAGADIARQIVAFAAGLRDETIPAEVTERLKACIVDSIGCALSARNDDAARGAREAVLRLCGSGPAAIWGTGQGSSADLAAFANGVAIRCQDWSDTYLTPTGGLHPSDMISALLALGPIAFGAGVLLRRKGRS